MKCAVTACRAPAIARRLCSRHYQQWRTGTLDEPHASAAGRVLPYDPAKWWRPRRYASAPVPVVCVCRVPSPDHIGMCTDCGRKVVTFAHPAVAARYEALYPEEWERALDLGLHP